MNDRLNTLQEKLQEFEVDGILITNPENRYYISGFTGSAGYLFITPDAAYLNTDFRYIEQATNQSPSFEIVKIDSELKWFIDLLIKHRINTLGFESARARSDSHLRRYSGHPSPARLFWGQAFASCDHRCHLWEYGNCKKQISSPSVRPHRFRPF